MDERYPCELAQLMWRVDLPADTVSLEKRVWNRAEGPRATCTARDNIHALIVNYASVLPNPQRTLVKHGEPSLPAPDQVGLSMPGMDALVEHLRAPIIEALAFDRSRSWWRSASSAAYRRAGESHTVHVTA